MSKQRILHCFGDPLELLAENLPERLSKLGRNLSHTLAGVPPEQWLAAGKSSTAYRPAFIADFPSITGKPTPGRLLQLANAIKPYDLVLSYGWGAIDVAMAHTLFSDALSLPPLVHHETALAGEEKRLSKRRSWYRRIALGKASGLVVPSERLEEIALVNWQQPIGRVKHFAPGIAVPSPSEAPKPDALPGVIKREGERWIGAALQDADEFGAVGSLIEALSNLPDAWHLVVMAGKLDTDSLSAKAENFDIVHRLHIAKPADDLSKVMGLFDLWASVSSRPFKTHGTLAAMAAAKPVFTLSDSDSAALLAPENAPHTAKSNSAHDFETALRSLIDDDAKRSAIGQANRSHVAQVHDEELALDRYRRLYASAMGTEIKQ